MALLLWTVALLLVAAGSRSILRGGVIGGPFLIVLGLAIGPGGAILL